MSTGREGRSTSMEAACPTLAPPSTRRRFLVRACPVVLQEHHRLRLASSNPNIHAACNLPLIAFIPLLRLIGVHRGTSVLLGTLQAKVSLSSLKAALFEPSTSLRSFQVVYLTPLALPLRSKLLYCNTHVSTFAQESQPACDKITTF